jgi:hypothetical protein
VIRNAARCTCGGHHARNELGIRKYAKRLHMFAELFPTSLDGTSQDGIL